MAAAPAPRRPFKAASAAFFFGRAAVAHSFGIILL